MLCKKFEYHGIIIFSETISIENNGCFKDISVKELTYTTS